MIPKSRVDKIISSRLAEVSREKNELKERVAVLEKDYNQTGYLRDWDSYLAENQDMKGNIDKLMKGEVKVVPIDPAEIEDPATKALLQKQQLTERQLNELKVGLQKEAEEREIERHQVSLEREMRSLTSQYEFLNDERDQKQVLARFYTVLGNDPNVTLADVVAEYEEENKDRLTKKVRNTSYAQSKVGPNLRGGNVPPAIVPAGLKLGEARTASAAREFLEKIQNE